MSRHTLHYEQLLPRPREEIFPFFADAAHLGDLTPDWLHFRILTELPIEMGRGTLIRYRIRWRGLPIGWTTRITVWDPPFRFVDEQIRGPYRLWRHEHHFESHGRGTTRMTDHVDYALPSHSSSTRGSCDPTSSGSSSSAASACSSGSRTR